jgi:ribulose-5-phosphate 4-epimerase/fuculose-1-phosphate aldolase
MKTVTEGVIQYRLDFVPGPPPPPDWIRELNAWRTILHRLGLTGLDPVRYNGMAYGNVSVRLTQKATDSPSFLISGSQTGGLERLTHRDYVEVTDSDIGASRLTARGCIRPSSEALTHAAVYQADRGVTCVIHVHSPELWSSAELLGLPMTARHIPYGTPEMAAAIQEWVLRRGVPVIAMLGHEDGILVYGKTIEEAAQTLFHYLAASLASLG